jgi:protein-arginine kinase activator protein McsA
MIMPDKDIHCYKCSKYLGVIRDAKLHKDMYYICGSCARPKSKRSEEYNEVPDFLKDIFGGKL